MNALTLPVVDPMMVRRFTSRATVQGWAGGVWVMDEYDVEDVGLVEARLDFDEDLVDCSQRVFELTNRVLFHEGPIALTVFPSRRWRNMRIGQDIQSGPDEQPLLYLGNPIRIIKRSAGGIDVIGRGEFLIKSGVELGY